MKKISILLLLVITIFAMSKSARSEGLLDADVFDLSFEKQADVSPFNISKNNAYEIIKTGEIYDVYLSDEFIEKAAYVDLARGLRLLSETDTVIFHVANYGGNMHGGMLLVHAILASKAKTVSIIESNSYSMAALLACATNSLKMEPYAYLMFHDYSLGMSGKGADVRAIHTAISKQFKQFIDEQCVPKGILTPNQADEIISGTDIYIFPADLEK